MRFGEALALLGSAMSYLSSEGIDNWRFSFNNAAYLALAGRYEESLSHLDRALESGMLMCSPIARIAPQFEPLRDDARLSTIEDAMIENINGQRQLLGLAPVELSNYCWAGVEEL